MVQCSLATLSSCVHIQARISKSKVTKCGQGGMRTASGNPSSLTSLLTGDWKDWVSGKSAVLGFWFENMWHNGIALCQTVLFLSDLSWVDSNSTLLGRHAGYSQSEHCLQ